MSALRRPEAWRYAARSIPWIPPVTAAAIATFVVAMRHGQSAALPLQVVAIALASGVGFALDDPAAEIMAASPTSMVRRRLTRVGSLLPPMLVVWVVLLGWQGTAGPQETWALAAVYAGLTGLGLGIAGVAARRSPRGQGGITVAPGLFIAIVGSTIVTPRFRPLPLGDVPGGWTQIYLRWTAAALVGLAVFLWSSRDPVGRHDPARAPSPQEVRDRDREPDRDDEPPEALRVQT